MNPSTASQEHRRLRAPWCSAVLIALAALASACSGATTKSNVHGSQRPIQILPAPAGLVSASAPQPNGTMWLLAGPSSSRNIRQLTLSQDQLGAPVPASPSAVAVSQSSNGVLAVGLATATTGAVELCSGTSGVPYATIPVADPVLGLVFGDDGTSLFVLEGSAGRASVSVISTSSGSQVASLAVPADTVAIAPLVDESAVYALEADGDVTEVAHPSGKVVQGFHVGSGVIAIALSPDGKTMYVLKQVGQMSARNVSLLSTLTLATTDVLPAPAHTVSVVLSPDGSTLYDIVGTPSIGNVQAFSVATLGKATGR